MLCYDASKRCDINAVLNHAYIRGAGGQTVTLNQLGRQLEKVDRKVEHVVGNQANHAASALDDALSGLSLNGGSS